MRPPLPLAAEVLPVDLPEQLAWLNRVTIAGNELWRILALFLCLLFSLALGRLLRWLLIASAEPLDRRQHLLAVGLRAFSRSSVYLVLALGLMAGMKFLNLHPLVESISDTITSLLLTAAVGYVIYALVDVVDAWLDQIARSNTSRMDEMLSPLVRTSLRATIVIMVFVQMITIVSEKPVASVIAGLGVGGLAIGLAAQDTIKNVFGSLMIFGDRPFELGDEIIVDAFRGNVERVGLRSTRFRTGDGYLVTMPNGELASKTIVNVSRRPTLTRNLNLPLSYDLPPEKAERAVAIVKEILRGRQEIPPLSPAQVFLSELTNTSMTLAISYQVSPPNWWSFVAFNESVNLEILRRFRAEDIHLAYPTQTVHLRTHESPDETAGAAESPPAGRDRS